MFMTFICTRTELVFNKTRKHQCTQVLYETFLHKILFFQCILGTMYHLLEFKSSPADIVQPNILYIDFVLRIQKYYPKKIPSCHCFLLFYMPQKLMIDEKRCYFFGRNKQLCDFTIDHASCSRVHTALMWHKHLNRPFLVDLGSSKQNN